MNTYILKSIYHRVHNGYETKKVNCTKILTRYSRVHFHRIHKNFSNSLKDELQVKQKRSEKVETCIQKHVYMCLFMFTFPFIVYINF